MLRFVLYIIVIAISNTATKAGNILILTPFGSISHKNLFTPIAKSLALHEHNVTFMSVSTSNENVENLHELSYVELYPILEETKTLMVRSGAEGFTVQLIFDFLENHIQMCSLFFEIGPFRTWLEENRTFDVVIVDAVMNDCVLPVAHLLSKSVILFNTATLFPWVADAVGSPNPLSSIPIGLLPFPPKMTFLQRFLNIVIYKQWDLMEAWMTRPKFDAHVKSYFPEAKTYAESLKEASLVLVNSDPVLSLSRPLVPNIVEVGGIHCRPAQPLKPDLQELIDNVGEEGFIIFSLGSIDNGALFSTKRRDMFLNAFSRIKQTVFWKHEANFAVSDNVKLVNWLPQQDLLGHPKARAFITHCGLLSMQEAVYHKVPMIGIPSFAEQPGNAIYGEQLGILIALTWDELSADLIYEAIINVTESKSIQAAIENYNAIFNNRLHSPLETALYWVEYIMRHPKAKHLQSSTKGISIVPYFMLDVLAVVFISLLIVIIALKKATHLLKQKIHASTSKQKNH